MTAGAEGAVERLLRRDRTLSIGGLVALCALAWIYVAGGAGLGASALDMTTLSLFPHRAAGSSMGEMADMGGMSMTPGMPAPGEGRPAPWGAERWALTIAMWWTMMIAMMSPSASPTVLLYARVCRQTAGGRQARLAPTPAFLAGYLLVWLGFSLLAAAAQWAFERVGLVSAQLMGSQSRWLSVAVLAAAGLYQLSALQSVCLAHCRSPAAFLSRHWRPGATGAIRLGVLHGAFCVGCCWLLMGLLFVGGVMNLAWIAALSVLVLAQKIGPRGPWVARASGMILLVWAAATVFV